jgi:hypothetical protein
MTRRRNTGRLRDQWPGWLIAFITATVIVAGIVAVIYRAN